MSVPGRSRRPLPPCAAADARALAGGTDLIPQLREGRRRAGRVVDLKRIPELTAISVLPGRRHCPSAPRPTRRPCRGMPAVASGYPAVAQSACLIGGVQVQNRASLGGNICNAAPSADAVPALMCYGARAVIAGSTGRRELPVQTLFKGPGKTSLDPGELLVSILLPPSVPRSAAKYLRFTPRREMDIAVAGAGTWLRLDADGAIAEARIVLASVGPTPMRAPAAERQTRRRAAHARAARGGRPARRRRRTPHLRHARLGRLSPLAGCRADGARARRLLPAAGDGGRDAMKTLAHLHRQRRGAGRARRHPRHPARAAARPDRPDRHQGRLRQRQLRHVHGAGGRRARVRLPDAGAGGAGP